VRDAQPNFAERELERARITLRTEFGKSLPNIEADRVQIQQVVFNLVRNAIEAMAGLERKSHVLTAYTKLRDDCMLVAITDTGAGVNPAKRERLFDALYTTKRNGIGLGLSICRKNCQFPGRASVGGGQQVLRCNVRVSSAGPPA